MTPAWVGPAIVATHSHRLAAASWCALWAAVGVAWQVGRTRPAVLDWCFGRRIWAAAAIALMLALWMLVNIGQFHAGVLACFVVLLSGAEVEAIVQRVGRLPRRLGLLAAKARPPVPVSGGLAYSRVGRTFASIVLAWHLLAVAVELVPATDATNGLREPMRIVTRPWLMVTRTIQSWNMWAPDPPREVTLLRVVVIDRDGRAWDMRTDVYAAERRPVPWIAYDRSRKMARRILASGNDGPYQRAYARWHCREWARTHDGVAPRRVELRAVSRTIPTPEAAREGVRSSFGPDVVVLAQDCAAASFSRSSARARARRGPGSR